METDLKKLLEAQNVDLQIDQLHANTREYPQTMARLKTEIETLTAEVESLKSTITENESNRRNIESEITSEREALARREARLLDTKTNKEYTAVQHEIEQTKERIDHLETEDLELMNELDSLRPKLQEKEQLLGETETANTTQIKEISEKYASIESDIAKLTTAREKFLTDVAPRTLATYNRLRRGKSGVAVVTVDPVKHSCRGCFKQLPPQKVLEVRRQNKLIFCENCGRILFWDTDHE